MEAGKDAAQAIFISTVDVLNRRYTVMQLVGDALAELIPQNGTILTQCFGETIVGTVMRVALRQGKTFRVFCAETRPYLQGARLTAGCFAKMGFDTTVITDNMAAYVMERAGTSPTKSAPFNWRFFQSILESLTLSPAFPTGTSPAQRTL